MFKNKKQYPSWTGIFCLFQIGWMFKKTRPRTSHGRKRIPENFRRGTNDRWMRWYWPHQGPHREMETEKTLDELRVFVSRTRKKRRKLFVGWFLLLVINGTKCDVSLFFFQTEHQQHLKIVSAIFDKTILPGFYVLMNGQKQIYLETTLRIISNPKTNPTPNRSFGGQNASQTLAATRNFQQMVMGQNPFSTQVNTQNTFWNRMQEGADGPPPKIIPWPNKLRNSQPKVFPGRAKHHQKFAKRTKLQKPSCRKTLK